MRKAQILIAVGSLLALTAHAEQWSTQLETGAGVRVDPSTNRAVVNWRGAETQLWDGIHRLEDGSTLIVRDGRVVPNENILQARRAPGPETTPSDWEGVPIAGYSPCEQLVRKVCGDAEQCSGHQGCGPAKQLLSMEDAERRAASNTNVMTYTSGQCQEALADWKFFWPCPASEEAAEESAEGPTQTATGKPR